MRSFDLLIVMTATLLASPYCTLLSGHSETHRGAPMKR